MGLEITTNMVKNVTYLFCILLVIFILLREIVVVDFTYTVIIIVDSFLSLAINVVTKEYILVREWTAPPCVFQTFAHPTSPCSFCMQYTPTT